MLEFKHSVKVPRHYKLSATILEKALTKGASVKSLVFGDKLRHFRTSVLFALISEAVKHNAEIDKLFESTEILKKEPRLDPWLAKILTVELLFGKKVLSGQSKPELTVASYKEQFEKYSTENPDTVTKKDARRPRYIRVNTSLLTTSDAIRAFQDEEYRFIRCTSGSYNDYLEQVKRLEQYDFMQDYHVKTVFVFAPGTWLHKHPLYLEDKIILQDKATAMAIHLLAPPPGSVVLDMCAAPGMKTTQLAAYMKNQGIVYAVERNKERYKVLCDFVEKTGSTCVQTINKDILEIKRGDYPDVEYILLDPSCSGSGMDLCAHNYIEDARLARLTSLQEKMMKHALNAFPKAKKIVYSTCSLFPQENERVVTNAVSQCRKKWTVLDTKDLLKDQWNNFGTGMYGSMGPRCLYARPETDLTTGFFLAVMEIDEKYSLVPEEHDAENKINCNDENVVSKKRNKNKKTLHSGVINTNEKEAPEELVLNDSIINVNNETDPAQKKDRKNKKKKAKELIIDIKDNDNQITQDSIEKTDKNIQGDGKTKKKAKEHIIGIEDNDNPITQDSIKKTDKNIQGDGKAKKKAKEHTIYIEDNDSQITHDSIEKIDKHIQGDGKAKKKAKEHIIDIEDNNNQITQDSSEEMDKNMKEHGKAKKKNKKSKEENIQDNVHELIPKRKKNKNKHTLVPVQDVHQDITANYEMDIDNEIQIVEEVPKKKKKKNNPSIEYSVQNDKLKQIIGVEATESKECYEPKKKRKKEKHNITDYVIID